MERIPVTRFPVGSRVLVLAVRHDFGISDLRGSVEEIGETFVTVAIDRDETQRGLGIAAIDVSPDRLEALS